jgi:DNA invertase Pin-like site-specific DNA recombinase
MTKAKRFVSWAAVSSLPQAQKISLTEQREINLRHIERYGGTLVADLIVDESRDIPELSEACERIDAYKTLRELIKSGGCDVVICLTRSRLGRVLSLVETIAELCRRSGIVIYETDAPPANLDLEGDKNVDLLTGAVRSWGAQREVEELRRRNQMGMLGKFKTRKGRRRS